MAAQQSFQQSLKKIFGGVVSDTQINEIISIVTEQGPDMDPELQLEEMINLLVSSGDISEEDNTEGAVGFTQESPLPDISKYYDDFQTLFPRISLPFLTQFCARYEQFDFHVAVKDLRQEGYFKTLIDPMETWEQLKCMLPGADPSYLKNQARVLANRPPGELEEFVAQAIENNDYPTLQTYLKDQEKRDGLTLYDSKFSVAKYLAEVPNPIEKFLDPAYKSLNTAEVSEDDIKFATNFLSNTFLLLRNRDITRIFSHYGYNLIKTCNKLKKTPKAFSRPRRKVEDMYSTNVNVLQEVAFLKHEMEIRQFLKQQSEHYRSVFQEAKDGGFLQTCGTCFDDQLIPEECFVCIQGCIFCKECVKTGSEEVIGRGEITFPCFLKCGSFFSFETLEMVLDKKVFKMLWRRKQIEEIRNANIDGLESCPHCDFCMVPNENDKVFMCKNVDCMKETCRSCQHPAHIPLRCEEIEYDEDVQRRTFIENKMSEAFLRYNQYSLRIIKYTRMAC